MNLNDILTLAKAGYTRNEIEQMDGATVPDAVPPQLPTGTPEPDTQPPEPTAPVAEPAPVATPTPAEPTMAELMQSIAKLTSAVQANAIAQSVIPGGVTTDAHTAEDMLAEIIRPTFKAREGI